MTPSGPLFLAASAIATDGRASDQVFFQPEAGTVGALQRRQFSDPWVFGMDFAVSKNTKITERQSIEFRMDASNILNHPTGTGIEQELMITRTALLYLSNRHNLKDYFSRFGAFKRITRRFIAGEEIDEAIFAIRELNALGITASFDHLGESISSEAEAEAEVREYLRVLNRIESSGIRANVSVKLTQLGLDIDESLCLRNARLIVVEAARLQNFVRIDMEDSTRTDATLRVFRRLRKQHDNVGVAIQAYLYRSERDIEDLLALGAKIRLCKGAYAEPASAAFPQKKDVDANYIKLMRRLLRSGIYHGIATHDEKIIAEAKDFAAREGAARDAFEFQMLYGIRRDLQARLIEDGYRVRTYVPYGAHWYPYFMRRLAERPANIWFVLKNLLREE